MVVRSRWVCKGELINKLLFFGKATSRQDKPKLKGSDPAWASVGWTLGIVIRSQSKRGHRGKGREVKHMGGKLWGDCAHPGLIATRKSLGTV